MYFLSSFKHCEISVNKPKNAILRTQTDFWEEIRACPIFDGKTPYKYKPMGKQAPIAKLHCFMRNCWVLYRFDSFIMTQSSQMTNSCFRSSWAILVVLRVSCTVNISGYVNQEKTIWEKRAHWRNGQVLKFPGNFDKKRHDKLSESFWIEQKVKLPCKCYWRSRTFYRSNSVKKEIRTSTPRGDKQTQT